MHGTGSHYKDLPSAKCQVSRLRSSGPEQPLAFAVGGIVSITAFFQLPILPCINSSRWWLLAQRSSVGLECEPDRAGIVYFSFHLKQ